MELRTYHPSDAEAIVALFRDAVLNLGRQQYTEEQTKAWARHPENLGAFRVELSEGLTLCADVDGAPVAFGQLNPEDHVAYLYCHPAHARRGYATAILDELEERASGKGVDTLFSEVSCVARPLFERRGYRVDQEEHPIRHGVRFLRFRMGKCSRADLKLQST